MRGGQQISKTNKSDVSSQSIISFSTEKAKRHCSTLMKSKSITSLSLNGSVDTNPSFPGYKMIK